MKRKPQLPLEAKVDLMKEVMDLLQVHYLHSPESALMWVLNNFTTFDLIALRDDLRERQKRGSHN